MTLIDSNLLLYSVDERSPFHQASRDWLTEVLNGGSRVALPWQTLAGFLRVATNPRVFARPLAPSAAWGHVEAWLASEPAWVPQPGSRHAEVLGDLIVRYGLRGNLVPDAQLAALALEHGLTVYSADTDFARFTEVHWENPVAVGAGT